MIKCSSIRFDISTSWITISSPWSAIFVPRNSPNHTIHLLVARFSSLSSTFTASYKMEASAVFRENARTVHFGEIGIDIRWICSIVRKKRAEVARHQLANLTVVTFCWKSALLSGESDHPALWPTEDGKNRRAPGVFNAGILEIYPFSRLTFVSDYHESLVWFRLHENSISSLFSFLVKIFFKDKCGPFVGIE